MPTLRKPPDEDEPQTYFERSRRKLGDDGDGELSATFPRLPEGSPWADVPPPEPLIDRTEDRSHG
jgi:hypothetical protein